ncbi:MAG: hypothetical protein HN576_10075 [Bacteriovoracaceae bacterium]|nr:hypothetical protein [Bacteriovoracaceae bacterium]
MHLIIMIYPIRNFFLFSLLSFLIGTPVNALCLKDIAAIGLSADSISYTGSKDDETASLSSNLGYGFKMAWMVYCPIKKIELQTYFRARLFSFSDAKKIAIYSGIKESLSLLSFGFTGRKSFSYKKKNFEIPLDIEARQEMGLIVLKSDNTLLQERFVNLKTISGLRYFAWSKGKRDITLMLKVGALTPLSGSAKLGVVYGASVEFFQKIGKVASLRFDLYSDHYDQRLGELSIARAELGLRTNLVFRL